ARTTGGSSGAGDAGSHESGVANLQRRSSIRWRRASRAATPTVLSLVPVLEGRVDLVLGGDELQQCGPAFLGGRNPLLERVHHLICVGDPLAVAAERLRPV